MSLSCFFWSKDAYGYPIHQQMFYSITNTWLYMQMCCWSASSYRCFICVSASGGNGPIHTYALYRNWNLQPMRFEKVYRLQVQGLQGLCNYIFHRAFAYQSELDEINHVIIVLSNHIQSFCGGGYPMLAFQTYAKVFHIDIYCHIWSCFQIHNMKASGFSGLTLAALMCIGTSNIPFPPLESVFSIGFLYIPKHCYPM